MIIQAVMFQTKLCSALKEQTNQVTYFIISKRCSKLFYIKNMSSIKTEDQQSHLVFIIPGIDKIQ